MSERQAKRRKSKGPKQELSREDIVSGTTKTVNQTKSAVDSAESASERVEAGELTQTDTSILAEKGAAPEQRQTSTLEQLISLRTRKPASIETAETVRYFRRLARTPFEEASAEQGLLLMLQDLDQPERMGFYEMVLRTHLMHEHTNYKDSSTFKVQRGLCTSTKKRIQKNN